ncbi:MAG: sigma-70 family RNA polymerase sigma factor [Burkholderiaceae bacterium]
MYPQSCRFAERDGHPGVEPSLARENSRADLAAWLSRIALGDRKAFRALYDATSAHLLGVAFTLLNNRAQAEEILQDAYVSVWKSASAFNSDVASPMTWLISIVRNRAIDLLRAQRLERTTTEPLEGSAADKVAAFEPLPEKQLQRAMEAAQIDRGLQQLPRCQRQALAMVLYRGMSYPEVAAAVGVPLPTAKSWIRRGVLRLKECLDAVPARAGAPSRVAQSA